jgi:DNA-binding protein HU-beta
MTIFMNKQALIEAVSHKAGITKVQGEQIVDSIIESIVNTLKEGKEVSIAGLGIFSTKVRAARQARNPRTGETLTVPSMRVPKFRPAKALKDAVK